ncbi:MAG: hypothetical protein HQK53_06570 [Oligoflexia bacterium]|nr:hypothetical protein [Oligoflexia bacterium]
MKKSLIFTLIAAALATGNSSFADNICNSSPRETSGYEAGIRMEGDSLEYLWQKHGSCNDYLDGWIEAVDFGFELRSSTNAYITCRNIGIMETLWNKIGEKQESCRLVCLANGAQIGRLAAKSLASIGVQQQQYKQEVVAAIRVGERGLCTATASAACKTAFDAQIRKNPTVTSVLTFEELEDLKNEACSVK